MCLNSLGHIVCHVPGALRRGHSPIPSCAASRRPPGRPAYLFQGWSFNMRKRPPPPRLIQPRSFLHLPVFRPPTRIDRGLQIGEAEVFADHTFRLCRVPLPKIDLNDLLRVDFAVKPRLEFSRLSNLLTFYRSRLRFKTFADVMIRVVR